MALQGANSSSGNGYSPRRWNTGGDGAHASTSMKFLRDTIDNPSTHASSSNQKGAKPKGRGFFMIMPYLLYMTKKYARAMLTFRGGMQWVHYGTPAVDDASCGARHGVPVEHATGSASATTGSTSRPGVQQGPRLWLHSDVAFNRQSVVTRPLSMIPSLAVDHHPEYGVPKDLDWIMDIWRKQKAFHRQMCICNSRKRYC